MILFGQDWGRFPDAIVDYETSNDSFVRMAGVLNQMGIKNCLFFLALHNPELQGVDPFDVANLTEEQKIAIHVETKYNPWYYFRELVRIPPKAGDTPIVFKLNRASLALFWLFFNHIDVFLIMLRQVGKTVSMAALVQGCLRFWMKNSILSQVTKDTKLKLETIDTIKEIGSRIPQYLIDECTEDNADNKTGIYYKKLNNTFKSSVGRNDSKAANGIGRGSTSPLLWFDEPPFIPFIGITVPAAIGGMGAVVEEAEKNKQPYGIVFTTTPGKTDDRDGGYIYKLVQEACKWTEQMYDCDDLDDLKSTIRMGSLVPDVIAVNATFTHNQLGLSDDWLREKIAKSRGSKEQADMDYRVMWATGGASSPLTVEMTDAIRDSETEPSHQEMSKDRYTFRWYDSRINHEHEMQEGHYVLGIDTSEAVGRDAIALVLTDIRDLSVRGTAVINDTNLTRFSYWLCDFLIQYPKITAIIERKSTGPGVIDHLLYIMHAKGIDPFKRLYNKLVADQHLRREEYLEMRNTPLGRRDTYFYDKWRRDFGFITDRKSRKELYADVLIEAVKRGGRKVRDKQLSGEIRALIKDKKGRVDHPEGGHDDMVIAWLMTVWFLMVSTNHSSYGITGKVFSDITETGGDISESDRQRGMQIEALHDELETAFDQLRKTENPYAIVQLEQRIRLTNSKIAAAGGSVSNLDGLIREALAERRRGHLNARTGRPGVAYGYN